MSRALYVIARAFLAIGILTLVAACGDDGMQDLRQFVKKTKARKPGRIEPLPEIKQIETFVYVPGNRRNPFLPTQSEAAAWTRLGGPGHPVRA